MCLSDVSGVHRAGVRTNCNNVRQLLDCSKQDLIIWLISILLNHKFDKDKPPLRHILAAASVLYAPFPLGPSHVH